MRSSARTATPGYKSRVATNASERSKAWARSYVDLCVQYTPATAPAIPVLADGERGNGNIYYTDMPAFIAEPGFLTHSPYLEWVVRPENLALLATLAVLSIIQAAPEGGTIALSAGHGQKEEYDPGVTTTDHVEADLTADVIERIARLLRAV